MIHSNLISIVMGAVIGVVGIPALIAPDKALVFFRGLYRSDLAARILTVVDMMWVGALLLNTYWAGFEQYKQSTYLLVPVATILICVFVDDLLMPRALGGLFLLIPAPVLSVLRWEPSSCRYALIVFCYLLIVAGFALIMNPFVYRKAFEYSGRTPLRFRTSGGMLAAFGVGLIALGLFVF
jgi:hypothetical protein